MDLLMHMSMPAGGHDHMTELLACRESVPCNAEVEGSLRLADGQAGNAYEYGRLEIFLRGVWSAICDVESFTPDSAKVACTILGYDGGAPLEFRPTTFGGVSQVQLHPQPIQVLKDLS